MANPEQPAGSQRHLREDALVEHLVPDPSQHQPAIQLTGFLGRSTEEGAWRLYLTSQLDEYVEFSEQDVLYTQSLSQERSPLGGTMIWFKPQTPLRHTRVLSRQVQADFLSGGITARFMPGVSPFMLGTRVREESGVGCTRNYVCSINPHIPACQVETENCPFPPPYNTGGFCPTREFVC
jgi:hypothetical protein